MLACAPDSLHGFLQEVQLACTSIVQQELSPATFLIQSQYASCCSQGIFEKGFMFNMRLHMISLLHMQMHLCRTRCILNLWCLILVAMSAAQQDSFWDFRVKLQCHRAGQQAGVYQQRVLLWHKAPAGLPIHPLQAGKCLSCLVPGKP